MLNKIQYIYLIVNKSNQHIKNTFFMPRIYVYPIAKNSNCYCKQIKNTFLRSELKEHSNFGTSLSSYFKTFISVYSDSDWTKKKIDKGGKNCYLQHVLRQNANHVRRTRITNMSIRVLTAFLWGVTTAQVFRQMELGCAHLKRRA